MSEDDILVIKLFCLDGKYFCSVCVILCDIFIYTIHVFIVHIMHFYIVYLVMIYQYMIILKLAKQYLLYIMSTDIYMLALHK